MSSAFNLLVASLGLENLALEPRTTAAGRGLFAVAKISPLTPLFTIPARALLNCKTLAPNYPPGLDAFQLISLHLCLYRPLDPSHSLDPLFGPYISTLPRDFDSHPLTGHVQRQTDSFCEFPPSVSTALLRLHARYLHDWRTVRGYIVRSLALPYFLISPTESEPMPFPCP